MAYYRQKRPPYWPTLGLCCVVCRRWADEPEAGGHTLDVEKEESRDV
jgi:hypothetical protein